MTEQANDVAAIDITELLTRYSFDLGGFLVDRLVDAWLHRYPAQWVRLAVIEALYQGRYKAVSVEQILNLWMRRGKSLQRFNHEFERIVCGRFSKHALKYAPYLPSSTAQPESHPQSLFIHASDRPDPRPSFADEKTRSPFADQATDQAADQALDAPEIMPSVTALDAEEPVAEYGGLLEGLEFTEELSEPLPKGAPVQPFKPSSDTEIDALAEFYRSLSVARKQPIHQFTPDSELSDFYAKLKAVAHSDN